jgi:PAS domain S-box-containing protein
MKLHWLTLKFSGNKSQLEAPFLSDYYRVSLPHIRISLILATLFYAAFGILDALLMPEQKSTIWFIRFVIVCPVIFGTLLASFSKSFERYMHPLLAGVCILAGGGIICMIVIAPPPVNYSYYAGLLLIFIWGYTFSRILFMWASLAGWVQVVLYEIAAIWISPTPFAILINNNFFFISANVIGMLACYFIEFYARRDFFLRQQLEIEREKVNKVNQELEERVEKRTADYQIINRALEQEIVGHKQAESQREAALEALRESESKYRFMTDNVADIIWTVDMNLDFTYISPAVQKLRGLTVEEAMKQKLHEALTPASLQHAINIMEEEKKALIGNHTRISDRLTIELEEYCKDGSTIWTENELKYLPGEDGKPIGIIGITRDITARRQAEEKFRLITENMFDCVSLVDTSGAYQYVSPSYREILGYSPEDMVGLTGFSITHPDDLERITLLYLEGLEQGWRETSFETMIRHKNGHYVPMEIRVREVKDPQGKLVGGILTARDITKRLQLEQEHKQAEEEKRRLEERLQHADKMESIGTLAGGIAHDFNNLLMGIQGYTSLTLLTLDPDDPSCEKLRRIEEQVQSGAELTKQLLGFARGGRYEVKPADMNEIIEKSSSMFGRTKKEITIHKKYEKDIYPVEVDLGQMEQVFMNLYVNAWQAMPGGGNIYLETENVLLDEQQALTYTVQPGRYIKISVTDTGTGIDEKTKERIFDPFFTTKKMGRGTGLGLAMVYGIIKGHKGMIDVSSEPGNGTTFTIYLPASEMEVVKEKAQPMTIARGKGTIMLVDDEKMVLQANKELLEFLGYTVYAFGSGQEAIAVYMEKRNNFDLVILDMIMPGISGGETFDRLREINSGIKVLLSSGYSVDGEAQTIMDRGCNGFLQKPFQIEKLSQKVKEMLD